MERHAACEEFQPVTFPESVVDEVGYGLGVTHMGGRPPTAKPWKGEGVGVFELVEDFRGDTYGVAYTVRFARAIYAFHCLQNKSPSGVHTTGGKSTGSRRVAQRDGYTSWETMALGRRRHIHSLKNLNMRRCVPMILPEGCRDGAGTSAARDSNWGSDNSRWSTARL